MAKRITKTPDIISAIKHRDLFGSLPAFESLDTWTAWLVWLKVGPEWDALRSEAQFIDLLRRIGFTT